VLFLWGEKNWVEEELWEVSKMKKGKNEDEKRKEDQSPPATKF